MAAFNAIQHGHVYMHGAYLATCTATHMVTRVATYRATLHAHHYYDDVFCFDNSLVVTEVMIMIITMTAQWHTTTVANIDCLHLCRKHLEDVDWMCVMMVLLLEVSNHFTKTHS